MGYFYVLINIVFNEMKIKTSYYKPPNNNSGRIYKEKN